MKKFNIWTYICLSSAILFSLFNINFSFNVSMLAFPISGIGCGFLVYYAYFKLFKNWEYKDARIVRKLVEYIPFIFLAAFMLLPIEKLKTIVDNTLPNRKVKIIAIVVIAVVAIAISPTKQAEQPTTTNDTPTYESTDVEENTTNNIDNTNEEEKYN